MNAFEYEKGTNKAWFAPARAVLFRWINELGLRARAFLKNDKQELLSESFEDRYVDG